MIITCKRFPERAAASARMPSPPIRREVKNEILNIEKIIGNTDAALTRENEDDEKNKNNIYQITRTLTGEWIAGNKYTYVLNLGDN